MMTEMLPAARTESGKGPGLVRRRMMEGEVAGVGIEYLHLPGGSGISEATGPDSCQVLLVLAGKAEFRIGNLDYQVDRPSIVTIPHREAYSIRTDPRDGIRFLRIDKRLDDRDRKILTGGPGSPSEPLVVAFEDCPTYTEDIKSSRTINRTILPEGLVPRFCLGSVSTSGPDLVGEHRHPMLDQLFLGLEGCHCTCRADEEETCLLEDMLIHIPLGSRHSVTVPEGRILNYLWLDFFLTLEGESYIREKHRTVGRDT